MPLSLWGHFLKGTVGVLNVGVLNEKGPQWEALIKKGALIGRRASNNICVVVSWHLLERCLYVLK